MGLDPASNGAALPMDASACESRHCAQITARSSLQTRTDMNQHELTDTDGDAPSRVDYELTTNPFTSLFPSCRAGAPLPLRHYSLVNRIRRHWLRIKAQCMLHDPHSYHRPIDDLPLDNQHAPNVGPVRSRIVSRINPYEARITLASNSLHRAENFHGTCSVKRRR